MPTSPEAAAQQTKVLGAEPGVAMMAMPTGGMPVVVVVVPAQLVRMSATRAGLQLVVPAAQVLRTALLELHHVMPEAAEVGTQTKQQTLAQSKVENVVPPWWAAQVHAVQTQLQVQSILDLEVAAADSTEVQVITPVLLEALELLWFDTPCLQCQLPT